LETMREILSRFEWTKTDLYDRGRETYFPPDRLTEKKSRILH
jgi:hypothetical protein